MNFTTKIGHKRPIWDKDKLMNRLTELGIKHNTDKASNHGFTDFYHDYMVKYTNPRLLEIGIYDGASLKMWEEYYGDPRIVGVDIEDKSQYNTNLTKIIVADQDNVPDLVSKCVSIYPSYDIIIDDGSHTFKHQISCFAALFPYLKSGGIYILEDLHTSFIGAHYNPFGEVFTPYDFVHRVCEGLEVTETTHATKEQIDYLRHNIAEGNIFQKDPNDFMHSITSVIIKK